eukprot:Phypoly_transcript_04185.p1 GENE.Phypoly_transcript_04185~~Phypoly_transcript_04185.p1  ORF type:complete len:706 (+),score=100.30 Phypoly_transcript_04185:233-2119(+)
MAPFSQIINQTYLAPLFRSLSNDSKQSPWLHEYAIVLFRDLPPHSDYLVQCSSFTKDLKQFATWCTSIKFGTGGYSANAVCEGLCAAFKLALSKKADERVFILFTNSSPNILPCRCCDNGDCMSHAKRIGAEHIMLSVIAPRQIDALKEIFINAKPSSEPEETHVTGDKPYLTLLRGLVLPTNAPPSASAIQVHTGNPTTTVPPNPFTVSTVPSSTLSSMSYVQGTKPFWQGSLAWSTGQAGKSAPMLPLMAQAPPGADLSLYTAHEWPQVLHVSGVCSLSEPGIANHSKTAPFADFAQLPNSKLTNQEQASFATFIRHLQINNWGAAVELPNRTMLIKPNGNKGTLRAMIIPKLALKTQRQPASQPALQGQPSTNPSQPVPPQPIPTSAQASPATFSGSQSIPAQVASFAPQPFIPQPSIQTISNFTASPSPTPMVTPSPPTNISTPPTPPLSSSNQYIGGSRSSQSVPIASVAQTNLFSPSTANTGNTRSSVGSIPPTAMRPGVLPLNNSVPDGQIETTLEAQLQAQPNQQPQLQQIQQQLHQHIQQAHLQFQQPQLQHQQQLAQQQLQQQLHHHQLQSPFQPNPEASLPSSSSASETGEEDDVVLLEVQPVSKKLKAAPQGQRAR